jgi:hypothetical protein
LRDRVAARGRGGGLRPILAAHLPEPNVKVLGTRPHPGELAGPDVFGRQRLAALPVKPSLQGQGPHFLGLRGPVLAALLAARLARQHVLGARLLVLAGLQRLRHGVAALDRLDGLAELVEFLVRLVPGRPVGVGEIRGFRREPVPELKDRLASDLASLAELLQLRHSKNPLRFGRTMPAGRTKTPRFQPSRRQSASGPDTAEVRNQT